jgi:hypothetical protein
LGKKNPSLGVKPKPESLLVYVDTPVEENSLPGKNHTTTIVIIRIIAQLSLLLGYEKIILGKKAN